RWFRRSRAAAVVFAGVRCAGERRACAVEKEEADRWAPLGFKLKRFLSISSLLHNSQTKLN
nr:hypothetical protein [Aeromonas jandaei]